MEKLLGVACGWCKVPDALFCNFRVKLQLQNGQRTTEKQTVRRAVRHVLDVVLAFERKLLCLVPLCT